MLHKIVFAAAVVVLAGCSIGADVPAAKNAAEKLHRQLDAGKFAEIYRGSSQEMKSAIPEAGLVQLLDAVHRKLGKFVSAPDPGWNDQLNTGGHFITLSYQSKYERGEATETIVFRIDGGAAKLAGYNIQSQALIVN
jgi:hypothetical protein